MDRGAWWATVHGVTKSQTQLSDFTHILIEGASLVAQQQRICLQYRRHGFHPWSEMLLTGRDSAKECLICSRRAKNRGTLGGNHRHEPTLKLGSYCLNSKAQSLKVTIARDLSEQRSPIFGMHLTPSPQHMAKLFISRVVQLLSHIWLLQPMNCSPPGSSVHGVL